MMGLMSQFVQLALRQIMGNEKELAQKIGADERIVKQVTSGIGNWVSEPERMLKLEAELLKQAREHDVQTYNKDDVWINRPAFKRAPSGDLCNFVLVCLCKGNRPKLAGGRLCDYWRCVCLLVWLPPF